MDAEVSRLGDFCRWPAFFSVEPKYLLAAVTRSRNGLPFPFFVLPAIARPPPPPPPKQKNPHKQKPQKTTPQKKHPHKKTKPKNPFLFCPRTNCPRSSRVLRPFARFAVLRRGPQYHTFSGAQFSTQMHLESGGVMAIWLVE